MRGSPNFSEDGEFLAAACSDGRGMLFDAAGKVLWQRELSKPAQIDNVWINASGRDGFAAEAGVILQRSIHLIEKTGSYRLRLNIQVIIVCSYLIMMEHLNINIEPWGQWSR